MAPTFRSSTTATGTAVSAPVSTPAGVAAGDLLVIFARWSEDNSGSVGTFVPPTGFTIQGTKVFGTVSSTIDDLLTVATKVADGTEGATLTSSFTPSSGILSLNWTLYALAFQNVGVVVGTSDGPGGSYPSNSTSMTIPSITMPAAGGLIAVCAFASAASPSLPAGMTSVAATTSFQVAYEVRTSGATGTRVSTFAAATDFMGTMIGLAPSPDATVHPAKVAATTTTGAPTMSVGLTALPANVAGTRTAGIPTMSTGDTAFPATVAGTRTASVPTTSTGSKALPASAAAVTTVGSPATSTGAKALPSNVAGVAAVGTPTVSAGAKALPAVAAATATVGTAVVSTGTTTFVATVAALAAVGGPATSATQFATTTPASASASATVGGPTVSAASNATATPTTVPATTAVTVGGGGASAWAPSLVSNLALWLDASQLGLSNGDPVAAWPDASGAGATTDSTGFSSPTFQTGVLNGLPVVRFVAASDQALRTTMAVNVPYSIAVIGHLTGGSNARLVGSIYPDAENWLVGWWNGNEDVMYGEGFVAPGGVAATTNWKLYTVTGSGALTSFYGQGSLIASNASGNAGPANRLALSGYQLANNAELSDGELAEIVVFDRVLTDPERQEVEGYLAWKWGMQAELPVGHPYVAGPPTTTGGGASISTGDTALPATAPATAAVGSPTISVTSTATATPLTVTATGAVGGPAATTTATATATPPTVAGAGSVPAATASTGTKTVPATVPATAGTGTPTISTGEKALPATATATATVGAPSTSTGTKATPAVTSAAATVGAPTVTTDQKATPATVPAAGSVGTPAITAGTTVSPAGVGAVAGVGVPTVTATQAATATPATAAATGTVAAPIVSVGSNSLVAAVTVPAVATTGAAAANWTPDLLAGLRVWLKADALTGLADGDPVAAWPDSSGSGHDGAQVSPYQPIYRTNISGGLPAVEFGGAQDIDIAGFGDILSGDDTYTLAILNHPTGSFGNYPIMLTWPTNAIWQWIVEYDASAGGVYWGHTNGTYRLYTTATGIGTWPILALTKTVATDGTFRQSGTDITAYSTNGSGMAATPAMTGAVRLGGYWDHNFSFTGHIAEVIYYSKVLAPADLAKVEGYLAWKWGRVGDLPAAHTYKTAPPMVAGTGAVVTTGETAAPATVPAAAGVGVPTVTATQAATVTPNTVVATSAVAVPAVVAVTSVRPATATAVAGVAVPAVVTSSSASVTPATAAGAGSVGAPTVTATSTATPAPTPVVAVAGVGAPTVSTGTSMVPATAATAGAVPAPTVTITASAHVSAVTAPAVGAVAGARVSTGTSTVPVTFLATTAGPAATVGTGTSMVPATLELLATIGAPVVITVTVPHITTPVFAVPVGTGAGGALVAVGATGAVVAANGRSGVAVGSSPAGSPLSDDGRTLADVS